MASRKMRAEQTFEGGINTGISLFAIRDHESSDELGFDTDGYPAATVRQGRSAYGAGGGAVTRLLAAFGQSHLIRAVGTKLQHNSSGTTWGDIAGSFADTDWDYTNFNDKLILTNGTDDVKQWNGSALSNLSTNAPKGKFIASSIQRVYIAHDGDQISFCGFQDETDWTSAENSGTDQFYTPEGGDITALTFYNDQITVFKRNALAVYYGNNYFNQQLVTVSNDIGCISFKTVKEVGDTLYWLGENDVYAFRGGKPAPIGERIRSYLRRINRSAEARSCAFTDGIKYYLCLPLDNATEPNIRLVYDPRYGVWRVPAQNEEYTYGVLFKNSVYVGDAAGQTYKELDPAASQTSIPWSITGRVFDEGMPEAEKSYAELHLQGYFPVGSTLSVAISTQDRGGTFIPLSYDPTTAADYGQNRNVIIPLDTTPLMHKARFRLSGTGPVEIERMQRYFRIHAVQR